MCKPIIQGPNLLKEQKRPYFSNFLLFLNLKL